ncbi:MAG: hypothetical protein V1676_05270 [Candidatus Diapherotrites archaeon]
MRIKGEPLDMRAELGRLTSKRGLLFLLLFVAASLIAYRMNFSAVLGTESQSFTLFQFFGPVAGAFLGPFVGAGIVLITEILNFALLGSTLTLFGVLRFSTLMFAAVYFGGSMRNARLAAVVPLLCMALFILHPVGSGAAIYTLYWLIPAIALIFPNNLLLKSFGATFTAHAIGSTLFLYSFPSTASFWLGLIPVVAFERTMFALGIAASFIALQFVLAKLEHVLPQGVVRLNQRYSLFDFNGAVKA